MSPKTKLLPFIISINLFTPTCTQDPTFMLNFYYRCRVFIYICTSEVCCFCYSCTQHCCGEDLNRVFQLQVSSNNPFIIIPFGLGKLHHHIVVCLGLLWVMRVCVCLCLCCAFIHRVENGSGWQAERKAIYVPTETGKATKGRQECDIRYHARCCHMEVHLIERCLLK